MPELSVFLTTTEQLLYKLAPSFEKRRFFSNIIMELSSALAGDPVERELQACLVPNRISSGGREPDPRAR